MIDPIRSSNHLIQQPAPDPRMHIALGVVWVRQAGDVLHRQPASPILMNTCSWLKKQGKEKKPDANLVGTPFPEP